MKTSITLYNSNAETLDNVRIEYESESPYPGVTEITSCTVLSELNGFESSDIQTDIEEQIRIFENVESVRLKCKVEYASDKKWSRIAEMNKRTCELLKVA